jgi:hypothetical protein
MSPTTKTLWVPGVSMLFFSSSLLLAMMSLVPPATWVDPEAPKLLRAAWLVAYLLFGALGAWWSRRVGGSTVCRFFSGMFPIALYLGVVVGFISAPPVGLGQRVSDALQLNFLLRSGAEWVVISGVALAIGTFPFLRDTANG